MNRFVMTAAVVVLLSVVVGSAWGDAQNGGSTVVIPSGDADYESGGGKGAPFNTNSLTTQFVYNQALLGDLPIGTQIDGMSFRQNFSQWFGSAPSPSTDLSYTRFDITISGSNYPAGSLHWTFADNIAPGAALVRSGALTIPANSFPGGTSPNGFGPELAFDTPYTYSGGDLLFTIRSECSGGTDYPITDYDFGANEYELSGDGYGAATAFTGWNGSPVVQLAVSVPEPSTAILLAIGAVSLLAYTWRRRMTET